MKENLYRDMLKLQDQCNRRVDQDWIHRGRNWGRAIRQEASEAVESCAWKWWKAMEVDKPNIQVELTDIWHFVLSLHIQASTTPAQLMLSIEDGYNTAIDLEEQGGAFGEHMATILESIAQYSHQNTPHDLANMTEAFGVAWSYLDLSLEVLFTSYMTKNVLNIFRQDNGYKEGTYIKEQWQLHNEDVEDNVVCFHIADGLIKGLPNLDGFSSQLQARLGQAYSEVRALAKKREEEAAAPADEPEVKKTQKKSPRPGSAAAKKAAKGKTK